MILFDRHDEQQRKDTRLLFQDLLDVAAKFKVSEYRAHVAFMDDVADQVRCFASPLLMTLTDGAQYNFNGGAQMRFNNKISKSQVCHFNYGL